MSWRRVANEGARLLLRGALLAAIFMLVFPRLPGVGFSGSALVALLLAVPFAILGRLGHTPTAVSSVNPDTGWVTTKSHSMAKLTARRWGWLVVAAIWITGFLILPSLLLRMFALIPATHLEFTGWWSTFLPALLFLLVHVVSLTTTSRQPDEH